MGHKLLFAYAMLLIQVKVTAQVSLILPVWSEFAVGPEQLLDGQIVSLNGGEKVIAEVSLRDVQQGDLILSARTRPFVLRKGTNHLRDYRSTSVASYGNNGMANYVKVYRRLPQGTFECCLKLVPAGGQEELIVECDKLNSESMAILDLMSPSDKDTIDERRPILTWVKSGDFVSGRGRMFRLTLVELKEGQTPQSAVRENRPVLSGLPLEQLVFNFPASAPDLIPGRTYAWVVDWLEQQTPKISTEVWTFTVAESKPDPLIKYVMLRRSGGAQTYEARGQRVFFSLEDAASAPSQLSLRLMDNKGKVIDRRMDESTAALTSSGFNQFELNLRAFDIEEGTYLLNVVNVKGDRYQIYIEYAR
jgi:hypothetical protein